MFFIIPVWMWLKPASTLTIDIEKWVWYWLTGKIIARIHVKKYFFDEGGFHNEQCKR